MKRKVIGMLLAGALCAATAAPAGAVSMGDVVGLGTLAATSAIGSALQDGAGALPVQDGQSIGFRGLESTIRKNNQTVQAFARTLQGIAGADLDAEFLWQGLQYQQQYNQSAMEYQAYDDLVKALQGASQSDSSIQALLQTATTLRDLARGQMEALDSVLDGLDDSQQTAQDELDDTYAQTEKQFENLTNGIIVGAQSAYIGIISTKDGIETLDRSLASLDRNIAVVQRQVELGMASELTLANLEQTRRTAAAQRQTLELLQTTAENQLSLLCGNTAGTTVHPTTMPEVTDSQLDAMDYEADLEQVLKNSYSIWSARSEVRNASNDYEDNVSATVDAYEAARLNLAYTEESVTNTFRQMYLDVQDKKRLLDEAEAAYDTEEQNFAVDQLQYDRGMISRNAYLTAQDDLAAQQDAVRTAARDLFTAYNTYDWAKRGYMAGTGA
nr:TolC family protein [uncultured Agathobaculum sp.]